MVRFARFHPSSLALLLALSLSGCAFFLSHGGGVSPLPLDGTAAPRTQYDPEQSKMYISPSLRELMRGDEVAGINSSIWRGLFAHAFGILVNDIRGQVRPNPDSPEFIFERGLMFDILHFADLALIDYAAAIEKNPSSSKYYNNRGMIYLMTGYPRLAVLDLTRAIELSPERPELFLNRGKARENCGDDAGAREDYRKAVELGICDRYPSLKICK